MNIDYKINFYIFYHLQHASTFIIFEHPIIAILFSIILDCLFNHIPLFQLIPQ